MQTVFIWRISNDFFYILKKFVKYKILREFKTMVLFGFQEEIHCIF